MIRGTLAAMQLYLRGHLVLHASAVQLVDHAVARVGRSSGNGKVDAGHIDMCADSAAAVITDDVLADRHEWLTVPGPVAPLGTGEVQAALRS